MHAGSPSAKRRRISSGSRSRTMKTSRLAAVGIRPALQPARRIERVLHGMDGGRPAAAGRRIRPGPSRAAASRRDRARARPAPWRTPAGVIGRCKRQTERRRCRGHEPPSARRPRPRQAPWASRRTAAALASASRASTIARHRIERRQPRTSTSGAAGARSVLVSSSRSATAACAVGLGIAIERRRAGDGIDRRHDAVEPQRRLEKGVGGERVEDGPGIGQAAGLQRDAPERRPAAVLPRSQQPVEACRQGPGARRSRCSRWAARRRRRPSASSSRWSRATAPNSLMTTAVSREVRAAREPGQEASSCRCRESRSAPRAGSAPTALP